MSILNLIRDRGSGIAISFDSSNQSDNDFLASCLRSDIVNITFSFKLFIGQIEVPFELDTNSINTSRAKP